jgi:hypothetical protein
LLLSGQALEGGAAETRELARGATVDTSSARPAQDALMKAACKPVQLVLVSCASPCALLWFPPLDQGPAAAAGSRPAAGRLLVSTRQQQQGVTSTPRGPQQQQRQQQRERCAQQSPHTTSDSRPQWCACWGTASEGSR